MADKKEKVEAVETTEPVEAPETPDEFKREISEKEKQIIALAGTGDDIPKVEFIRDLFFQMRGQIPKQIRDAYPERSYRWETFETLKESHYRFGGYMEAVTAGNHERVKDRSIFNESGLVTYKGDHVLAWTSRELTDEMEKITQMRFSGKLESLENPNDKVFKHPMDPKKEGGRIVATTDTGRAGYELDAQ